MEKKNIVFIGLDIAGTFSKFHREEECNQFIFGLKEILRLYNNKEKNIQKVVISLFTGDDDAEYLGRYTNRLMQIEQDEMFKVGNKCFGFDFYINVDSNGDHSDKIEWEYGKGKQFKEYIKEIEQEFEIVDSIFIDDRSDILEEVGNKCEDTKLIRFSNLEQTLNDIHKSLNPKDIKGPRVMELSDFL